MSQVSRQACSRNPGDPWQGRPVHHSGTPSPLLYPVFSFPFKLPGLHPTVPSTPKHINNQVPFNLICSSTETLTEDSSCLCPKVNQLSWGMCSWPSAFLFLNISGLSELDRKEGVGGEQTHFLGEGSFHAEGSPGGSRLLGSM